MECKALKFDGCDEALIGISDVWDSSGCKEERFIYSGERLVLMLMERDGCTAEEAMEHIAFNIEGAYVGPNTPDCSLGAPRFCL